MDVGWTCAYLQPHLRRLTGGTVYVDSGANIIAEFARAFSESNHVMHSSRKRRVIEF